MSPSYESYEQSVASGEPIELYHIYDENGEHWRYCTSEEDVTYNGDVYESSIIDRSEMVLGENSEVNALTVKLKRSNEMTNTFIACPVESVVRLVLYRQHADYTAIYWSGVLVSVTHDGSGIPTCRFEPVSSESVHVGARRCNQRLCDHVLYGYRCDVDAWKWKVEGVIAGVSGIQISAVAFGTKPGNWFVGGEIVTCGAHRLITYHVGTIIKVSRSILTAEVGDSFEAYAGCDHTPTTCNGKFSNKLNYGGNEFLPVKNPYAGSIKY